MNNKDAIKAIKINYPPERYTMLREALDLAIVALERETPMNPINKYKIDFGVGNCGGCLKCGCLVNYQMAYCPDCGQKIDWNDEKVEEEKR